MLTSWFVRERITARTHPRQMFDDVGSSHKDLQMPGGGQYTMRSRKVWTLSADRMCLSCDMGLLGIPFGLLFSCNWNSGPGAHALPVVFSTSCVAYLEEFCFPTSSFADRQWTSLRRVRCAFGGIGSSIDRRRRTVSTRRGWLGLIRQCASLDECTSIRIRRVKCPFFYYSSFDMIFEVSLVTNDDRSITVGYASTKPLAADIENELRCFLVPS